MPKKRGGNQTDFDIIIAGGGLAGLSLAALLGCAGVRTLCLDRDAPAKQLTEKFDGRTTAVSYGSRKVLEAAAIWPLIADDSCPINLIHILDGESDHILPFDCAEVGGKPFGWIVENRLLRLALMNGVKKQKSVTHLAPAALTGFENKADHIVVNTAGGDTFTAKLLIGADGRESFTRSASDIGTRRWNYRQTALVCTVTHENPHNNIAVEHFHAQGPFAILPMNDDAQGNYRSSVVWSEHGSSKDSFLHADENIFNAALQARFPAFYGKVEMATPRMAYPLNLVHAHEYIAPRVALVAEAAHGIHPIAGQGLNLSLRDIAEIASLITTAVENGDDPGSDQVLKSYQQARRPDNMLMAGATDALNRLFSNNLAPARIARRIGLRMVAKSPTARKFFMTQAMGTAGFIPALLREDEAA